MAERNTEDDFEFIESAESIHSGKESGGNFNYVKIKKLHVCH